MEVVVPMAMADFHFDSTSTSPYMSAPSSPRAFGNHYYNSAPTSPTSSAAIYHHFRSATSSYVIPLHWEETTGKPNHRHHREQLEGEEEERDAEASTDFEFSGQLLMGGADPLTADELFEAGKIRPLKLPPRLQQVPSNLNCEKGTAAAATPVSPISPRSPRCPPSRLFRSPRRRRKQEDFDPFAKAIEETTRGRDRTNPLTSGTVRGSRRTARSLSPLRGFFDFGRGKSSSSTTSANSTGRDSATTATAAASTSRYTKGGSKKWRLKDLLLFRSASEGRVTGRKDPLRKYTRLSSTSESLLSQSTAEDMKNTSFRSTDNGGGGWRRRVAADSGGSVGGSSRRRGMSAHEVHYTANRAVSEELKRKTFLPYRQGVLGCLGLGPAIHGLAKGFGSLALRRS